jgi:hypothetical protein
MSDVKDRLARLDTLLDEAAPPVDVAEVLLRAQTAPVVSDVASRRTRPAPVALAAGAATLILVGGLTLMLGTGDRSEVPPATTPPGTTVTTAPIAVDPELPSETSSPVVTPTTSPVVTSTTLPIAVDPVASEAGWSRWPLDATVFGNSAPLDVVSYDDTLVAVGATHDCVDCGPSVWLSGNGVDWTRTFTDPNEGFMRAATVGEDGIVAVGETSTEDDESTATVWTSPDGTSWTRGELPGGQKAWDVASGGPGYVAVGYVERIEGSAIYDDAAVWTSTDGLVWTRIEDDADLFTNAWVTTIVTTPDGLAAFGLAPVSFEVDEDGIRWYEHTLGVWTSADGVDWTQQDVGDLGDLDGGVWWAAVLDAVTAGDSILVAAENGLWLSTDDLNEWQHVSPASTKSVTSTGSSFFAALTGELDGVPILQSDDATSWVPITDDPSILFGERIAMTTIRPGGPGLIAFGISRSGSAPAEGTHQLWTWSPDQ